MKLPFKIIYAWDNKHTIFFIYRNTQGKKQVVKISNFSWYFCITEKDYRKIPKTVLASAYHKKVINKIEKIDAGYVKIFCYRFSDFFNGFITQLKKIGIECLEMDLSLTKRFLIDNPQELEENLKIGYFDIETDDSSGTVTIGDGQIYSWAIIGEDGEVFSEIGENEKMLLTKFLEAMDKYDVLVGWNSSNFDTPYIKARLEKHNILPISKDGIDVWKRTMQIDLMMRLVKLFAPIMSILGLKGFSLNEVSKVFLKKEKIDLQMKIHEAFVKNRELLKTYNINDCMLVKELNAKMQTLALMIKESVWTGCFLDKFFVGELLDNYILSESKKKHKYLRSRPNQQEELQNKNIHIIGGYVQEPLVGSYKNIRVFDFKSLYPTIIASYNIGEETLNKELSVIAKKNWDEWLNDRKIEEIDFVEWHNFLKTEKQLLDPQDECYQTGYNQYFKKSPKSVLSDLVKNLLEQRKKYKKLLDALEEGSLEFANARAAQEVIKELTNSLFGITADSSSRYFNAFIANSITITGQFWNKLSSSLFKKLGYETLYADTDSVFIVEESNEKIFKIYETINSHINSEVQKIFSLKIDNDVIKLEYEKHYEHFILLDKKRYVGRLVWSNGKQTNFIHSKGTENIKRDTIEFTRRKLLELIDKIFSSANENVIYEWIKNLRYEVFSLTDIDVKDFAISKKLTRPIAEYKTKPVHVRLAEELVKTNKLLETKRKKISWGERISYIITNHSLNNGAVLTSDFNGIWDKEYYWNVQIYSPLKRILRIVYPTKDWDEFAKDKLNVQMSFFSD